MDIETSLKNYFLSVSEINSVVGSRVRPVRAKQGDTGAVLIYQRIGGGTISHLSGTSGGRNPKFIIKIYSQSYTELKALSKAVQDSFEIINQSPGEYFGTYISGIVNQGDIDITPSDSRDFGIGITIEVWHR